MPSIMPSDQFGSCPCSHGNWSNRWFSRCSFTLHTVHCAFLAVTWILLKHLLLKLLLQRPSKLMAFQVQRVGVHLRCWPGLTWRSARRTLCARCESGSRWADGRVEPDDENESSSELRYCARSGVDDVRVGGGGDYARNMYAGGALLTYSGGRRTIGERVTSSGERLRLRCPSELSPGMTGASSLPNTSSLSHILLYTWEYIYRVYKLTWQCSRLHETSRRHYIRCQNSRYCIALENGVFPVFWVTSAHDEFWRIFPRSPVGNPPILNTYRWVRATFLGLCMRSAPSWNILWGFTKAIRLCDKGNWIHPGWGNICNTPSCCSSCNLRQWMHTTGQMRYRSSIYLFSRPNLWLVQCHTDIMSAFGGIYPGRIGQDRRPTSCRAVKINPGLWDPVWGVEGVRFWLVV